MRPSLLGVGLTSVCLLIFACPLEAACVPAPAETAVDAARRCAGWLQHPDEVAADGGTIVTVAPASARDESLMGAGLIADELFGTIVEIAVERAKRQGLVVVHRKIEDGVCNFPRPADFAAPDPLLPDTCAFVRSTDMLALLAQARALRVSLTSDITRAAATEFSAHFNDLPAVRNVIVASTALVRRFAMQPGFEPGPDDVAPIAEAFLNAEWARMENGRAVSLLPVTKELAAVETALSSARVYVLARELRAGAVVDYNRRLDAARQKDEPPPPQPKVLAGDAGVQSVLQGQIVRCVKVHGAALCPTVLLELLDWTNLAVRAFSEMKGGGTAESPRAPDFKEALRVTATLVLDVLRDVQQTRLAPGGTGPDPDRQKRLVVINWTRTVLLAAIDADMPHLISALATLARDSLIAPCTSDECADRTKTAALLSGIAAYSLAYADGPANATEAEKLQFLQAQRTARKEALESIIDAATDRRNRGGDRVWSLATAVGAVFPVLPQGEGTPGTFQNTLQLQVPMGVAWQRLPGKGWKGGFPFHLMFTFLDLGNYVTKDRSTNESPDWRAMFFPGLQAGIPLSRSPSNFFVFGGSVSYSPRFSTTSSSNVRSAWHCGLFTSFFLPLWDLN